MNYSLTILTVYFVKYLYYLQTLANRGYVAIYKDHMSLDPLIALIGTFLFFFLVCNKN